MKIIYESNRERKSEKVSDKRRLKDLAQSIFLLGSTPYLILELDNGNYLQVAGESGRYSIEYREYINGEFKHYVIGRSDMVKIWSIINSDVGPIGVMKHEVLSYEEVKIIFLHFFEKNDIQHDFIKRNVTKLFQH